MRVFRSRLTGDGAKRYRSRPIVPFFENTTPSASSMARCNPGGMSGSLSVEQRLVFILAKNQGMKYAEIADALGVPVGTVRSRMHSAVQKLQKLLRKARE